MVIKILNALRWMFILPLCIALYFGLYLLLNAIYNHPDQEGNYSLFSFAAPLIGAGGAGFAVIQAAYFIAPNGKHFAGLIVFILVLGLFFYGIYFMIANQYSFRILLETIGTIIGGIWGFSQLADKPEK